MRLLKILSLLLAGSAWGQSQHYILTPIPVPAGYVGPNVQAGTNGGVAAGLIFSPTNDYRGFWYDGTFHVVPTIGGVSGISQVWSINDNNVMTGTVSGPGESLHAFIYDGTTMQSLTLGAGSAGRDINILGQVVGDYAASSRQGFIWDGVNTVTFQFGTWGVWPHAINDQGVVVGMLDNHGGTFAAIKPFVRSSSGVITQLELLKPHVGGTARDVNGSGMIVGEYQSNSFTRRAVMWNGATTTLLPPAPGFSDCKALSINEAGHVVGDSYPFPTGFEAATRWIAGVPENLNGLSNAPGWLLLGARHINDAGQIFGVANYRGRAVAFTLTPTLGTLTNVPPSSFQLVQGVHASGGLGELLASNNSYLRVWPNYVLPRGVAPIQIEVEGTSPNANPANLTFSVESAATSAGGSQTVELFDFSTNAYTLLDAESITASDWGMDVFVNANAGRYIQPGTGKMKARLSFTPRPDAERSWQLRVDRVVWIVHQP